MESFPESSVEIWIVETERDSKLNQRYTKNFPSFLALRKVRKASTLLCLRELSVVQNIWNRDIT